VARRQEPTIARGEVVAPPIPAFGAVERIGACAIRFGRASDDERRARLAAYRARLPRGAEVTLTERGDRARRVTVAIDPARLAAKKRPERLAERLSGELERDTAELWGLDAPTPAERALPRIDVEPDGRAWATELGGDAPGPGSTIRIRVVVRVDLERRRIDAALIGDPLPAATVCAGPGPALDVPRMIHDVLVEPVHEHVIDPRDVGPPQPVLRTDGDVVHWVAGVPVGADLAARASTPTEDWMSSVDHLVLVDPVTDAVIGRQERGSFCGTVPMEPAADEADRAFGPP
jgi:hypothetical protein